MPHYTSLELAYQMENKMSLIHHAIKCWGWSYIIEDEKSLNEKT
jgi:hypothetical protein